MYDYIDDNLEFLTEAQLDTTYFFRDNVYPKIHAVLSTPEGQKKFTRIISEFVNRNNTKLTTIGPVYQVPFTENDKAQFYSLFEIDPTKLVRLIKDVREKLKTSIPPWQSLCQNPIFVVLYYSIRYFTINKDKDKDSKMLNSALIIMALAVYPSIFYKYFRRYTINSGVMQYTIDNLSQRFLIKKSDHIFGTLTTLVQNSWQYHESNIKNGSDDNCAQFAWRVHNDQNSLIKRIANVYNENKRNGLTVTGMQDIYDDNNINVDIENDTNKVENITNKIVTQIIINGVDLKIADFAANAANISRLELRNYLTKIILEKRAGEMKTFIESILFIYLYYEKHTYEEINSRQFIVYALSTFKKTNSKDENITKIKKMLDKWGEDSGLYARFSRLATRVDYTKGIYLYFIMCIQRYG